jgi:peptidoglycan/LPS O-acetylase OafA/YrhL
MKKASMTTSLWIVTLIFLVIPWIFVELTGLGPTFLPSINSHFPSALGNFYFGILIAGLDCQGLLRKKWANFGLIGVLLFPVCLFSLAWLQIYEFDLFSKVEPSLICLEYVSFACLLLFVANPQHWIARILCTNWLRWCGIVSYEWYLFHQPILLGFRSYMGQAGGNITKYSVMVFGGILISALTAALVYRFFSLPILKYGRSNK